MTLPLTPVRPPPTRRRRMVPPALTIGGLGLATLALHVRDPHQDYSWGACPSALLGFWCPGCGGLRAVNDLTNFQLADAASSNLAFVVSIPLIVFLLARWTLDRWRGTEREVTQQLVTRVAAVVLPFLLVFMVLRNLPTPLGTWLAP